MPICLGDELLREQGVQRQNNAVTARKGVCDVVTVQEQVDTLVAHYINVGDRDTTKSLLHRLRNTYRESPTLFTSELVTRIQEISHSVQLDEQLEQKFGYDSFRAGQKEVMLALLARKDCVAIMPTGAGKSLLYQLPLTVTGRLAVVVSPLISLMQDQTLNAESVGFRTVFLNSTVDEDTRAEIVHKLRNREYDLLYLSPEGLDAGLARLVGQLDVAYVAVDEAHCISHWGHDFRPSYRHISQLRRHLPNVPFIALTATAGGQVKEDIISQLDLQDPYVWKGESYRANLKISVILKGKDAPPVREQILRLVRSRPNESGIIYALSRKNVESTALFLRRKGVRAVAYHAGLEKTERERVQNLFKDDEADVVVATVAFGMGIDKSNVRYVIHQDLPKSISGYIQEIGRAGRDGEPSDCVLFYSYADVKVLERFAQPNITGQDSPVAEERYEGAEVFVREEGADAREDVYNMYAFAQSPVCYHKKISTYFGERLDACETNCSHCAGVDTLLPALSSPASIHIPDTLRGRNGSTVSAVGEDRRAVVDKPAVALEGEDEELFVALKTLRTGLAKKEQLPAYIVFSDAALRSMVELKPSSMDEFLQVKGVGAVKAKKYGHIFLDGIQKFMDGTQNFSENSDIGQGTS